MKNTLQKFFITAVCLLTARIANSANFQIGSSTRSNQLSTLIENTLTQRNDTLYYSRANQAAKEVFAGNRIPDDIFTILYDLEITTEIKNLIRRNSSQNPQTDADTYLSQYFKNLTSKDFSSQFLDPQTNESSLSFFVELNQKVNLKKDEDLILDIETDDKDIIDYTAYLKNINNTKANLPEALALNSVKNVAIKMITHLDRQGHIKLFFYPLAKNEEKHLLVFSGKNDAGFAQKTITLNANNELVYPNNELAKMIGIIKLCTKNKSCIVDDAIWKNFSKQIRSENLERYLQDAIEDAFSHDSKFYTIYDSPMGTIASGSVMANALSIDSLDASLNELATTDAKYQGIIVKKVYNNNAVVSENSAEFKFENASCLKGDHEECLNKNEAIYVHIPDQFHDRIISEVILAHRQNPADNRGTDSFNPRTGAKVMDQFPAFTSVQFFSEAYPYRYAWRYWAGPASSPNGGKYAEHKDDGDSEFDNLYEWPLKGHHGFNQKAKADRSLLKAKYMRIVADGVDRAYVKSVTIKFLMPKADQYLDWSFTQTKTDFGDPITMDRRSYGGGQKFAGQFPGAIVIDRKSRVTTNQTLPANWSIPFGRGLIFNLPAGKKFSTIEVACGDTHPDSVPNKDGGTGSLGASRLTLILITKNGKEILTKGANLGPQGVVTGAASDSTRVIQEGDQLQVLAEGDNAYIMAIRVGLND
jgi:hypothetical protein